MVALPSSGTRSVADLAGKRIGISAPDTLTKSVLADNHVDASGVKKIEPLTVKYAKIDPDTAARTGLPALKSTVDVQRLQRVRPVLVEHRPR